MIYMFLSITLRRGCKFVEFALLPLKLLFLLMYGPIKISSEINLIIADSCIAIHLRA